MRSTFFFIVMLFFVSCSKDLLNPVDMDTQLLEITKDPSSEAVFATMAVQLQAKGGFQRVLGLLNELVHDSKEQLHSITKIWRGVHARCIVTSIKLKGRQEYFETYLGQSRRHVAESSQRLTEVRDHLKGFRKSQLVYGAMLKTEIGRHAFAKKHLKHRIGQASAGLKALKTAYGAVKHWTPKGKALVQTHLEEVSRAYLQVKEFKLASQTEFLERTTDTKVRSRILQWMSVVRRHLVSASSHFRNSLRRLSKIGGALEKALARMTVALKAGVKHLIHAIIFNKHMVKAGRHGVALFAKLVKQNKSLISSNTSYCRLESVNYHKNRVQAVAAIRLFRQVRNYFVHHYRSLPRALLP
jgi:hypothetical protein